MYRCSICAMSTEKLQNCNGFFTTHLYPPFLKFRQSQEFSLSFRQQCEAFTNNDMRLFKTQTSDTGPPPPPPRAGPLNTVSKQNYLSFHQCSLNFIRLLQVVINSSVTTLLRRENDSKQSDEIQAITSVTTKEMETKLRFPHLTLQKDLF